MIISRKKSTDETQAMNTLSSDIQNWFDNVFSLIMSTISENDNELILYYQVEAIIQNHKQEYQEILSDDIQDYYIEHSYTVEADINNTVATKSLDNIAIKLDYFDLPEWIYDTEEIEKQIRKQLRYNNNTRGVLNKYLPSHMFALTATELLDYEIDQAIIDYMSNNIFVASEHTLERVTQEIYDIIKESYGNEGNGIQQVRNDILQQFDELKKYEAERIARTETLKAQGSATHNRLVNNPAVDYVQWMSTPDELTRDSHAEIDGEITYADGTGIYSNGLRFPGDESGDIEEWINCRCTEVAYIPEPGFVPPVGADNWYEDEMLFDTSIWNIEIPDIEVSFVWD